MRVSQVFIAPDGRLRATWRAFLFLPAIGLLLTGSGFAIAFFLGPGFNPMQLSHELLLFLNGVVSAPAVLLMSFLFLRWLDRRSFRQLGFWFYKGWGKEFAWGFVGGVVLITAVVAVIYLGGSVRFSARELTAGGFFLGLGWNLLLFLLPAAFEELLFRGYLFQRLVEGWGEFAAIFVLSALFGLGHLQNPAATALSVANTALIGILFAVTYLRTRGLWLPLGLHYAWNFWLGTVASLPVSGIEITHRLFDPAIGGPKWFTGGAYGPEGSVVTTVLVLGVTAGLVRTRRLVISSAQREVLD